MVKLLRRGGDYLPRRRPVGMCSTPLCSCSMSKTADYEVMKYLEDFQLTSGSRCVLYKGTGRVSFWLSEEAKWSGEA